MRWKSASNSLRIDNEIREVWVQTWKLKKLRKKNFFLEDDPLIPSPPNTHTSIYCSSFFLKRYFQNRYYNPTTLFWCSLSFFWVVLIKSHQKQTCSPFLLWVLRLFSSKSVGAGGGEGFDFLSFFLVFSSNTRASLQSWAIPEEWKELASTT